GCYSDYAGATQDRKSTTRGCQFLGNRLISWQCKKQTVVATSTTEAEYVAAASCCGQVLWIQNQLLDYGYNFINTVINIDNNNLLTEGFDAGRFQYLVSSMSKDVGTPRYLSLVVPLKKVSDEAVHKELDDRMERASTTTFSLEAEQDSVFINQQLGDMSTHKKIFVNPFHTKKVFANMKRDGKDFSGRITPLFDTMMVQASEEVGKDSDHPTDFIQIPILNQPSTSSKPKKKQPSKKTQRQEAEVSQDETEHEESVHTPFNDP
ncbi:hypothetical protein Tco_1389905, partial [Tanacetum coccineum]